MMRNLNFWGKKYKVTDTREEMGTGFRMLDEFPSPPLSKAVDCLSLLWCDGLGGKSMKFCHTAVVHFNKGDKSKVINCKGFENCDF